MLAEDFAHFRRDAAESPFPLTLREQAPNYDGVPPKAATIYTPRNVSFTHNGAVYVDYSGRALAIYQLHPPSFQIESLHPDLLYEAAYLFLLSRIGEFLDARRMHRIHAMALAHRGKAVLAIFPMGGGKSTLAAELLKNPEFQFLSDDSPFIDSRGHLHAFPLRLGLLPDAAAGYPPEHQRVIHRMEFGPKVLLNYAYLAHRVVPSAAPGLVFLGRRSLSAECIIEPAGKLESYRSMLADCAIGLGLFQGLEFIFRSAPSEMAAKSLTALSRLRNARKLFARSRVFRLTLGRDRLHNAQTISAFITNQNW